MVGYINPSAPRAVLAPEAGSDSGASWKPAVGGWVSSVADILPQLAQASQATVLLRTRSHVQVQVRRWAPYKSWNEDTCIDTTDVDLNPGVLLIYLGSVFFSAD